MEDEKIKFKQVFWYIFALTIILIGLFCSLNQEYVCRDFYVYAQDEKFEVMVESPDGELLKVYAGDVLTFTTGYENVSAFKAVDVEIYDKVPDGTTYVPGSMILNEEILTDEADEDEGDYNITRANMVTFYIVDVPAGEGGQVSFQVQVNEVAESGSPIASQSEAIYYSDEEEPTGYSSWSDTVQGLIDIIISQEPGNIQVQVFYDQNTDGVYGNDTGDALLSDVEVRLYEDSVADGLFNFTQDNLIDTQFSNEQGEANFLELEPGNYWLYIDEETVMVQDAFEGNEPIATNEKSPLLVELSYNQEYQASFGYFGGRIVRGKFFYDQNNNGYMDDSEINSGQNFKGVVVKLFEIDNSWTPDQAVGDLMDETQADSRGEFIFFRPPDPETPPGLNKLFADFYTFLVEIDESTLSDLDLFKEGTYNLTTDNLPWIINPPNWFSSDQDRISKTFGFKIEMPMCGDWQNDECLEFTGEMNIKLNQDSSTILPATFHEKKTSRECCYESTGECWIEENQAYDPVCHACHSYTDWQNEECVEGEPRRVQVRFCDPVDCGPSSRFVFDFSCSEEECECNNWVSGDCLFNEDGNYTGYRLENRECLPSGCDNENREVMDENCVNLIPCVCTAWVNQGCEDNQMKQTRTCMPNEVRCFGDQGLERLVDDSSCQPSPQSNPGGGRIIPELPPVIQETIQETTEAITETVEKVVEKIIKPVVEIVKKNVVEPVIEAVKEKIIAPVAKVYKENIQENETVQNVNKKVFVPTVTTVAIINVVTTAPIAATAVPFTQYLLQILKLIFTEPAFFLARKRKYWGTVYDSLTKQPVALATIGLYSAENHKLLSTKVTGADGRYYFLIQPLEKYYIKINTRDYQFPSQILQNEFKDGIYENIYHGEEITSKEGDPNVKYETTELIEEKIEHKNNRYVLPRPYLNLNIPVDLKSGLSASADGRQNLKIKFDNLKSLLIASDDDKMKEYKKMVKEKAKQQIGKIMSYFGPILGLSAVVISPSYYTLALLAFHVVLFFSFRFVTFGAKIKPWGNIYDIETGEKIGGAVMRLFSQEFGKLLYTQTTLRDGRYGFKIGKDKYILTCQKPGYEMVEGQIEIDGEDGFVKEDVALKKIQPAN
ncbi:MAG: hypothetical protein PHS07_00910 [Patescibacteria group bacterium]|nr:hypothetical protein [Patescibacteria group bacterium]